MVAAVMGSIAFALALLLIAAAGLPLTAGSVAALVGAGLFAAWLTRRQASARSGWGRGCLVNGLLSAAVAIGFRAQDDLWAGRPQYTEDLDRAIGPLTHFVWALAARIGLIALILATVLFALSFWLLGPPHRKA
ncbi:MAG: hypothetical protein WA459_10910 [Stellaceae bacterium]